MRQNERSQTLNASAAADRARDEQGRRDEHDPDAAVPVGDAPRVPGADRAADEGGGDREAEEQTGRC